MIIHDSWCMMLMCCWPIRKNCDSSSYLPPIWSPACQTFLTLVRSWPFLKLRSSLMSHFFCQILGGNEANESNFVTRPSKQCKSLIWILIFLCLFCSNLSNGGKQRLFSPTLWLLLSIVDLQEAGPSGWSFVKGQSLRMIIWIQIQCAMCRSCCKYNV